MKAAIVTIGDELLIGQVADTNSSFIAKTLDNLGFQVVNMRSIADKKEAILETLGHLQDQVDLVIMTGGLGPTKDDITKKTLCSYFNDELIEDATVLKHVTDLLKNLFGRELSEINRQQSWVPSQSKVFFNKVGTAPGILLQKNKTFFISLPGVPFEMRYLMENEIAPWVLNMFEPFYNVHRNILTHGIGESLLAERIAAWEDQLPASIHLAYLPSPGVVKLRLSSAGKDKLKIEEVIHNQVNMLTKIIPDCIVSLDEQLPIEHQVAALLKSKNFTIAVAESCTGGKLASCFTGIPGASQFFRGGIVTYATDTKVKILGVSQDTIDEHSVVSAAVAIQMAERARDLFQVDFAIASTGNAGPSKGDSDADVGTVFIGIATPDGTFSEAFKFGQPREKVVKSATNKGLELVYKELLKNF